MRRLPRLSVGVGSRMTDGFRNVTVLRGGEVVEQRLRIGGNGEHGVMLGIRARQENADHNRP